MRNLYDNALYISDGACNPSGICHTLLATIAELREAGESTEDNPALALMVHQLAHITGALALESSLNGAWTKARETCKEKANEYGQRRPAGEGS